MSLQLHRPDGEGGLEPRPSRARLAGPAPLAALGHAAFAGSRLPDLKNPRDEPDVAFIAILFWVGLAVADVRAPRPRLRDGVLGACAADAAPVARAATRR